jgi:transposase
MRAILIAVRQPDMRFVTPKTAGEHLTLAWHRLRKGLIYQRTSLTKHQRGLLAEFGIWLRKSPEALKRSRP